MAAGCGCNQSRNGLRDCPKIDIHTHIIPKTWPNWNDKFGYSGWLHIQHDDSNPGKATLLDGNGNFFRSIDANCWSAEARLNECSLAGVNIQVLSTVPGIGFNYWAKADDALEVAKFINDDIAQVVQANPDKFVGLGTVPLQDPALAIAELRRCVLELGFPGVQIGSHVNDWNLDAPELEPFWQAVSDLDAAVFVHPWDMRSGPRYSKHWFPWLLDMPNETATAIASVLMGGLYDRWPNLRLCFAHGGGSILNLLGRIDHGFKVRPDLCQTGTESLKKIWVDSLVHDEDILKLMLKKLGDSKIILGSDYPFPLGEVPNPGELIQSTLFSEDPTVNKTIKAKLLFENAVAFLKLDCSKFCTEIRK